MPATRGRDMGWTKVLRAFGLAGLLWPVSPDGAHAQSRIEDNTKPRIDETEAADEISVGGAVDDSFSIYGMPIPIVDPTIGNGLAVGVLATFRLDPDDEVSPRSTVAAGAGYTDTRTYA